MTNTKVFNQLGGNTFQTNLGYTGNNATIATDTAHWYYAGTATTEAGLTNADIFSVSLIPQYVAMAQGQLSFPIKPVVIKGVEVAGILFLHPNQVRDLKTNFTAGEWGDIYRAALQGGQITGNPIFTSALGFYDNVIIHQDARVPWGDTSQNQVFNGQTGLNEAAPTALGAPATGTTSVGRAIFVGAQSAAFANGAEEGPAGQPLKVRWVEELDAEMPLAA